MDWRGVEGGSPKGGGGVAYHDQGPRQCPVARKSGVVRGHRRAWCRTPRRVGTQTGAANPSSGARNADEGAVSKSIYVVGAIGLGGCLVLSLMMQHLLKVQGDRTRPAVALEFEEELSDHLRGQVDFATLDVDGERTWCIRLPTKKGVPSDSLARAASDLLWRRAPSWPEAPERLRLEVTAEGDAAPYRLDSHPPGVRTRRATKHAAPPAAPPSAPK